MTFEELRKGSQFHKVKEHDSGGGFTIYPADQKDEECLQRFHEIVDDADQIVSGSGYKLHLTNKSTSDPKGRSNIAIFLPVD